MHFPLSLMLSTSGACLSGILMAQVPDFVGTGSTELTNAVSQGITKSARYEKSPAFSTQFRSLFTTAIGCVHLCLAVMQLLHQDETEGCRRRRRIQNINQKTRIYGRGIVGLLFILVGNLLPVDGTSWLLIVAGMTTLEVVLEEYGRIRGKSSCKDESSSDLTSDMIVVNRE
jgi:hypothetical protein